MNIVRSALPALLSLLVACTASTSSTSSSGTTGSGAEDRGLEGPGAGGAESAPDTNPDGVPYPTENLGTQARMGNKPGNVIQNFKFVGYVDGDMSKGLQPVSLAQYFDPTGTKYKLIHIQASGSWCTYCRQEAEVVTPMAPILADRKVVWLMSLAEGKVQGTPSTKADLDKWMATYKSPFTHLWDSGNAKLGIFYDSAALPWNATINAKTMEILMAGVGAKTSKDAILSDIDYALELVDQTPAK